MESSEHVLHSFVARVREAIEAKEASEAHDALDHLALELASEERLAYGAFARFDKNRNHFLQGIEIVPGSCWGQGHVSSCMNDP